MGITNKVCIRLDILAKYGPVFWSGPTETGYGAIPDHKLCSGQIRLTAGQKTTVGTKKCSVKASVLHYTLWAKEG